MPHAIHWKNEMIGIYRDHDYDTADYHPVGFSPHMPRAAFGLRMDEKSCAEISASISRLTGSMDPYPIGFYFSVHLRLVKMDKWLSS